MVMKKNAKMVFPTTSLRGTFNLLTSIRSNRIKRRRYAYGLERKYLCYYSVPSIKSLYLSTFIPIEDA